MQQFEYILRVANEQGERVDPEAIGMPPGIPSEVRNGNRFADIGNGRTELRITEYSYSTAEAAEMSRQGLEQCVD